MNLAQAQAELTALNAAIIAILNGTLASYSLNGRSATKLDMKMLYDRQATLTNFIARVQNGTFSVVQFRRPE